MINPNLKPENINNPIYRGNPLNDPSFYNQQGYNTFDLMSQQSYTFRFGEITPTLVADCVAGDRHILRDNLQLKLNQIPENLYSTVRMHCDYFSVPLRLIYPNNYDLIIANPTKGDDIPWDAEMKAPLFWMLLRALSIPYPISFTGFDGEKVNLPLGTLMSSTPTLGNSTYFINQILYVSYALSRGQLLDNLQFGLEFYPPSETPDINSMKSYTQNLIDGVFNALASLKPCLTIYDLSDSITTVDYDFSSMPIYERYNPDPSSFDLEKFRDTLYRALENGHFIYVSADDQDTPLSNGVEYAAIYRFYDVFTTKFNSYKTLATSADQSETAAYVNLARPMAYQLTVAEYFTNDSVDNIYSSDLYWSLIRSVMFPSTTLSDGTSTSVEPTFTYNGVSREYDYLTIGGFREAFDTSRTNSAGYHTSHKRIPIFISLLLFQRHSLRYGDYFTTARPRMLAVGDLSIPVNNASVYPLDVTKNLVLQRYLNAVNRIGSKFIEYVTGIFGVRPSNTGVHPSFIGKYVQVLNKDTVTNVADNQGKQSTNLNTSASNFAFDVFIDDFSIVLGLTSFDCLSSYSAGVDRNFYNRNRFELFNSMLQNIGDQPIYLTEVTGVPNNGSAPNGFGTFGYSVRNAEYKFSTSRVHGGFVNNLPGKIFVYKLPQTSSSLSNPHINPLYIRDYPRLFDQFLPSLTGLSPAQYYHFECSKTLEHTANRKMQFQPTIL